MLPSRHDGVGGLGALIALLFLVSLCLRGASAAAVVRRESAASADGSAAHSRSAAVASLLETKHAEHEIDRSEAALDAKALADACCRAEDAAQVVEVEAGGRVLPDVELFKKIWYGKMDIDRSGENFTKPWQQKLAPNLRVLMGILSKAEDVQYRDTVRQSWMKQPGVCGASPQPVEGCHLYVVFVIGKPHNSSDERLTDMLHLDVNEGVAHGKVQAFFHEASRKWTWPSHIGKMDIDAFVHVQHLLQKVPPPSTTCESYFGALLERYAGCGLQSLRLPFAPPKGVPEATYACMSGSLYLLSTRLAQLVSEKDGYCDKALNKYHKDIDKEDVLMGFGVSNFVRDTKTCVDFVEAYKLNDPGDAWDHCGVGCKTANLKQHGFFR